MVTLIGPVLPNGFFYSQDTEYHYYPGHRYACRSYYSGEGPLLQTNWESVFVFTSEGLAESNARLEQFETLLLHRKAV